MAQLGQMFHSDMGSLPIVGNDRCIAIIIPAGGLLDEMGVGG